MSQVALANFPTNTREQIEFMIGQDGRDVTFYVIDTLSGCYACSLDPTTNTSTDSFCPVCHGVYWIPTYSGITVSGHVTWGRADSLQWPTGGMVNNGDCQVKVMYSGGQTELLYSAEYVMVDDRKMNVQPNGVIPRGVPEVNRVIFILQEEEA